MRVERRANLFVSLLCCALVLSPAQAIAEQQQSFFTAHGDISVETQNDSTYRSQDDESEINDLYLTIEPNFAFGFGEQVSLETALVLEPVSDPGPSENRYVEDQGIFVEQLFLQYATRRWGVRAGKLNPHFGIAWDVAPGIYGADMAEDYEITERIGAGGFLQLGNDRAGFHRLAADIFLADTTFLSRSTLNERGRRRRSDAGPSNTAAPRSFSLTIESEQIPTLAGLGYHLGFSRQKSEGGGRDEYGYVAALAYAFSPGEDIAVELLSEYAYQHGAEGERLNRHYVTQSGVISWKHWNLAVSSTLRDCEALGERSRDHLVQLSTGYEFEVGLTIDVGWRRSQEDGTTSQAIGVLLGYALNF
ncbi:MAG: hypothetical protein GY944_01580 [bacterium]|nr:hypothetical protein [bacterium]